ncbi:MAG: hybrid sensor histidine kinase/response regulator [Lachnospiraceae bacterium]
MGLLDAGVVENLLHSSSVDKGIERTIEHFINELSIDSLFVIHYEEGYMEPKIEFEWDRTPERTLCSLEEYIHNIEGWYHFEDNEMFVARATTVLSAEEKKMYHGNGYESVVEYQMTNHGLIIGYIVIAWNEINDLSDETVEDVHVIFKLMNEMLCKDYFNAVVGESEESLFRISCNMTKTALYMVDQEYRISYCNEYAKTRFPNIKTGDNVFTSFWGEKTIKNDNPLYMLEGQDIVERDLYLPYLEKSFLVGAMKVRKTDNSYASVLTLQETRDDDIVHQRQVQGKKLIFAMRELYKDMIAVEIRKDRFHDFFATDINNQKSYSRDFVLKWLSKVHIDDKQKFLECFDVNFLHNAYMSGTRNKEIDFRYRTHEGEYHCMNGQIIFEQNTNKDITVYIFFRDVEQLRSTKIEEERKMRETILAARSAAELKGQILANISHEIRTPMSGIISMSSVARQVYKDEDRLLECLNNIDDYSEHMMQVMDELLDAVKVDNDSIIINQQPFRLDSFLNRIKVVMRDAVIKKNILFSVEMNSQNNQLIGDEIRLQQAVYYLMSNAVANTPVAGSVTLSAKQIATDKKKAYIRFIIDDTGSGLTDKMKECIFGYTNDSLETIEEQHFDLSLAAKLINLMGGQISVFVDGAGTHLDFTLPFEIAEDQKKSVKRRKSSVARDYSGRRILMAEDSEMSQDALRAVLEVVGFEVDAVDNGKKAVIQFISNPVGTYDAILMDINMPYMDGREATKCIRISGKEDGETIPIVGLMANTYDGDVEESKKAGMQTHLSKPVDVNTLYRILDDLIPEKEE